MQALTVGADKGCTRRWAASRGLPARRSHAVCSSTGRREFLAVSGPALALGASLLGRPAHAFLGIGEDRSATYVSETGAVIKTVQAALEQQGDSRESALLDARKQTNDWVAKYRRDNSFSGRPSYGNTYTAVNALAGHLNSFGATAPIPKKRLERIQKELADASRFLERNR